MDNYDRLNKALKYAMLAHENQKDKAEKDYIFHPVMVALQCNNEDEKIVALLHDAIEDGEGKVTIDQIRNDFGDNITEAVKQLTHNKEDDYFTYLDKIDSLIALKVKLADLTMNMDLNRIKNITQDDLDRVEKYKKAKQIIENKIRELE